MRPMDLFDHVREERLEKGAPLAARMRPQTLDEFVGQEHIIGPGRLLRRAIQADQLSSLIFYGPPGTGKTTLARVIANSTQAHFEALNAVLAGVKDIRAAIESAQEHLALYGRRTILFVDEVHRFNKAQQDALLPWVENGTVIFVGATTENPYFEVNKALVSRSRIFQLHSLNAQHLRQIVAATLSKPQRGYGHLDVTLDEDALDHLVGVANGDARAVLNALELAVETTPPPVHITLEIAEESIQRRAVLYDKEGDYHFDTISAFIKSLRGSDPDAALYWMAKMLYAGEDPRFLFRRMLIFAGEDVGMADPNAVQVVVACAESFDRVGMPEGRFPLSQAALYLATAAKSNSAFALFDALTTVAEEPDGEAPNHLKDANRDKEGFGHGEGYLYPHAYRDHWVAQQYLPTSLQGKVFYRPSDQGYEARIQAQVARRREAQLAAMLEGPGGTSGESWTFSPQDPVQERWLQRTISSAGDRLGLLRDRVLDGGEIARHHVVLDLKAGSGLLTWEAVRRAPEGGIFALASSSPEMEALQEQAASLDAMRRPTILLCDILKLPALLAADSDLPSHFDVQVGRNVLLGRADRLQVIPALVGLMGSTGVISLVESMPRFTQRIYKLLENVEMDLSLARDWAAAEEALYADPTDPMLNWSVADVKQWFVVAAQELGISALGIDHDVMAETTPMQISPTMIDRWFTPVTADRPSYAAHLARLLSAQDVARVQQLLRRHLLGRQVMWGGQTLFLRVRRQA